MASPPTPKTLTGEARAEWRRIVPDLEAIGELETVDRSILLRYCVAWGDWHELNTQLQATSKLIRGARGNLVRNPLWIMRSDIESTLSDLGRQLGLSPASRRSIPAQEGGVASGDVSDKITDLRSRRLNRAANLD